jgi:endonuclease/exonuclease/phosphatase family metal-dependent hydrolase
MDNLPLPGEVLRVDSRCGSHGDSGKTTIRLVQWNIERGYQLPKIIEQLKELDADIVCLQEVDIGCERTGRMDVGAVIAHELEYEYLFVCEFEELLSPVRDASLQGGGVHGNAILSKYDITSWSILEHSHHPVDWNDPTHPRCQKEPRRGRRLTLAADIATPLGSLRVYTVHLEVRRPCCSHYHGHSGPATYTVLSRA